MKKIIYTSCFLCLFAIFSKPVQAQTTTFGLRGGLNIANLKDKYNIFNSSLTGFTGGFYTNIRLGKSKVTFSPEVLYIRKGAKDTSLNFSNGNGEVPGKQTVEIDYIEVPVLFKYNFIPEGPINPAFYAGPYAGVKVRGKTVVEAPDLNYKEELDETPIKVGDFGLVVGGSIGFGRVNVGVRYEYGLLDIRRREGTAKFGPIEETKNRVLSFVAGVGF